MVAHRRVVEQPVEVATPAARVAVIAVEAAVINLSHRAEYGVVGDDGAAHVDFVALAVEGFRLSPVALQESESALPRNLAALDGSGLGQKREAGQAGDIAFDAERVADKRAHHLVAAADADDLPARLVRLDNRLVEPVFPKEKEVVEGVFRAGEDDDVRFSYLFQVVCIERVEARVGFEGIEVGEVRHVPQEDDGDVDFALGQGAALAVEDDRVLLLDHDIPEIRDDADDRDARQPPEHLAALVEEADVSPELVDDHALHQPPLVLVEEHDASVNGGEDAAPVDVGHEEGSGVGMARHAHIDDVAVAEVQLGDAPCAFKDDGVEARREPVEGLARLGEQALFAERTLEILAGGVVSHGASVEDDLGDAVARRLEEDGVHVGVRSDATRLCLDDLRASHLTAVAGGEGIEGHILSLERGRGIAILLEYPAEGSVQDAFARVGAGADEHDRAEGGRHCEFRVMRYELWVERCLVRYILF